MFLKEFSQQSFQHLLITLLLDYSSNLCTYLLMNDLLDAILLNAVTVVSITFKNLHDAILNVSEHFINEVLDVILISELNDVLSEIFDLDDGHVTIHVITNVTTNVIINAISDVRDEYDDLISFSDVISEADVKVDVKAYEAQINV